MLHSTNHSLLLMLKFMQYALKLLNEFPCFKMDMALKIIIKEEIP